MPPVVSPRPGGWPINDNRPQSTNPEEDDGTDIEYEVLLDHEMKLNELREQSKILDEFMQEQEHDERVNSISALAEQAKQIKDDNFVQSLGFAEDERGTVLELLTEDITHVQEMNKVMVKSTPATQSALT